MISLIADTHTHTLACDHAYSTFSENVEVAAKKGLKFLAMTEHSPSLPGGPSFLYFSNLHMLPRYRQGVMILKGIELNILDYTGELDTPGRYMDKMEWVIASYHQTNISPAGVKDHTNGWMHVANNPLVHVIGHCGDPRYPFDIQTVVKEFAATGKIVEINSHSFSGRMGSGPICRQVALCCAQYGVPIVVSSDAHFCDHVGNFTHAVAMLEEIDFPQELILNAEYDRFLAAAQKASGKQLIDEK